MTDTVLRKGLEGIVKEVRDWKFPEKIRSRLSQMGYQGIPRQACSCVLAAYFKDMTGMTTRVDKGLVTFLGEGLDAGQEEGRSYSYSYRADVPIRLFVHNFDQGLYPELIRKPEEEKNSDK